MWKNAIRNRRRSALTIISMAFSLCLLGVLFALYRGLFWLRRLPDRSCGW